MTPGLSNFSGSALNEFGGFDMNEESLKKLCKLNRQYIHCPELNNVIHLQQKGISQIKCLEAYSGLRTLYLEANAISTIEGLEALVNIRTLYLNQNLVKHVGGLESLVNLEVLDLADNQIRTITGLSCCPLLHQLNLSGNRIEAASDVHHLLECKSLLSLDMSKNQLKSEEALAVLRALPLTLLRVTGNPIVSTTEHYRKKTISLMPTLQYFDDSPVFEKERRYAEAWTKGGPEAEKQMREKIIVEEAEERQRHRQAFEDMVNRARAEHAARSIEVEREAEEMSSSQGVAESEPTDEAVDGSPSIIGIMPSPNISLKKVEAEMDIYVEEAQQKAMEETTNKHDDAKDCQPVNDRYLLDNTIQDQAPGYNGNMIHMQQSIEDHGQLERATAEQDETTLEQDAMLMHIEAKSSNVDAQQNMDSAQELLENVTQTQEVARYAATIAANAIKEREFKRKLQDGALQRAVTLTEGKSGMQQPTRNPTDIDDSNVCTQTLRPVIWGTTKYRDLWLQALTIDNKKMLENIDFHMEHDGKSDDNMNEDHQEYLDSKAGDCSVIANMSIGSYSNMCSNYPQVEANTALSWCLDDCCRQTQNL